MLSTTNVPAELRQNGPQSSVKDQDFWKNILTKFLVIFLLLKVFVEIQSKLIVYELFFTLKMQKILSFACWLLFNLALPNSSH